jgi:hypothetical protein
MPTTRNFPRRDELPFVEAPPRVVRYYKHTRKGCPFDGRYGLTRITIYAHCNENGTFVKKTDDTVDEHGVCRTTHKCNVPRTLTYAHREVWQTPAEVYEWMRFHLEVEAQKHEIGMYDKGWTETDIYSNDKAQLRSEAE